MTRPPDHTPEPPLPEMSSLPRDLESPPALEDRVVEALAGQRLIRYRRVPWLQIAAAVALFALGATVGRSSRPVTSLPVVQPRFLMLLLAGPNGGDENARVVAYRDWAIAERNAGRQISGDRLASEGLVVEKGEENRQMRDELQGFFIVSGASLDDVAAVARSSPHVQGGGRVIVRPIDTP